MIGHHSAQGALIRRDRLARMLRTASRPSKHHYTDWPAIEAQRERVAQARTDAARRAGAANREVEEIAQGRASHRVTGREIDGELQGLAEARARLLADADEACTRGALNARLVELDARPFAGRPDDDAEPGERKRARCPDWWLRQLRRASARRFETDAIRAGAVGGGRAAYCSDTAVRRRARSVKRAQDMLAATELENEDGEIVTLKACFEASTSHKPIRRGELMTRIRGCEDWADERGMSGVFLTLTAPSRFHSQGGKNRRFDGSTPRDAQRWLCNAWERARSALARNGVKTFGFRVAEPHRDACPHWHALFWVNGSSEALVRIVRAAWLKPIDPAPYTWVHVAGCPAERRSHRALFRDFGADRRRVLAKSMDRGGASGYIAKYIAKNIDDVGAVGVEGHRDDWEPDTCAQADLFGGTAARVDAWASTWGIRQFQAIGQPPVTVWRELRRVDREAALEVAPMRIDYALTGAHRVGDERASWFTFLKAMGGVNTGRDYAIRIARLEAEQEGRYETVTVAKPIGVYEAGDPAALVPSVRKQWRPRGSRGSASRPSEVAMRAAGKITQGRGATVRRSPPWTRFNNCTREGFAHVVSELLQRLEASRYRPDFDDDNAHRPKPPDHCSLEPLF